MKKPLEKRAGIRKKPMKKRPEIKNTRGDENTCGNKKYARKKTHEKTCGKTL